MSDNCKCITDHRTDFVLLSQCMYFKPCLPTNKLHDACIFRYTSATTLSSKVSSFTVQSCCVVGQHLLPTTVASREVEDELEVDANREGTKEAPALSAETG